MSAPGGIPQQLVVPVERADFGWQVVDATGWLASQLEGAIGTVVRHRFDLATEIPLRARLFRVADEEHVLVAVAHHIAADGWSISPLVGDLGVAYAARCAGRAPGWAPLAVQYVDYTLWQRAQLGELADRDSPIGAQVAYWEEALAGLPERLVLPTDRPYPAVADYRGASVTVEWPVELQQRVARVAREHDATSFMVVQAALAVLLAKISASREVAVGFAIAGRRDPALDEVVGFFVNTLVLRTTVAPDCTVAELLAQVQQRSLAAFEHQDVPFEVLVERLNPTRSLAHHPLVQVVLAWQNNEPATGLSLGDLQATPLSADTHTARMDLTLSLVERFTEAGEPAGIGGAVEFRTDVFDPASIQVLIGRFERVLEAMTTDPARRVASIDVLDEAEHAGLDGWGNRVVLTQPASPGVSIPVVFAAQVARAPEAVALSCEGVRGRIGRWRRPLTGWRTCWPTGGWARVRVWGCWCRGRRRRSWRSWRCSRAGRRMCRSTRGCRRPGSDSCSPMPRSIAAITTTGLRRRGWTGVTCWSSISTTPGLAAIRARACRRRPLMISPTSSTPRALPGCLRGWRSPTTTSPS